MKIIALIGSPHGGTGNTARLTSLVTQAATIAGAEVETIFLTGPELRPCRACDTCHRRGDCPQDDEFSVLRAKISAADALILASPNYIYNVSAQLKTFMDRCCGIIHLLDWQNKYGLAVVTSGGGGDDPVVDYMNRFLIMTGIHPVGSIHATMAAQPEGDFTAGLHEQAGELGRKLVQACREGFSDPGIEMQIRDFGTRMRELVHWRRQEWPHEYQVWQGRQAEERDPAEI